MIGDLERMTCFAACTGGNRPAERHTSVCLCLVVEPLSSEVQILRSLRIKKNTLERVFFFDWRSREDDLLRGVHGRQSASRAAYFRLPLPGSRTSFFRGSNPAISQNQKKHSRKSVFFLIGDLERIRTSDPQLRRLLLYPAELRDHSFVSALLYITYFIYDCQ